MPFWRTRTEGIEGSPKSYSCAKVVNYVFPPCPGPSGHAPNVARTENQSGRPMWGRPLVRHALNEAFFSRLPMDSAFGRGEG